MARKIKLELAITGTDADEVLTGSNDDTNGNDVLDGGGGNDTFYSFQGADILTGGAGADTFVFDWSYSNAIYGQDTITDFSAAEGDKINFSPITTHYSEADLLAAITRAFDFSDLTITPIAGGEHVHGEVVADNGTWDVDLDVLGSAPLTETDFIFA
jgi:Ca2+-binding RTX toxin-like protein